MTFFAALGYRFSVPEDATSAGSILLCGATAMHTLQRRKFAKKAHMQRLLFDPQLYFAGLQASQAVKLCARLGSYPWFGISAALGVYNSGEQKQAQWQKVAESQIASLWRGRVPESTQEIANGVRECVDLQVRIGCEAIILPSPLTYDPNSSYAQELVWLDQGLAYVRNANISLPVYASVALADVCLRYSAPDQNELLNLIADVVSARGVNGVYIVVEQGAEAADARQCGSARTLASLLHLTHLFAIDSGLTVVTNFVGAFGLACTAVGATVWASGWYKSLHRLRLADQGAKGRAYPMYWSGPAALDVNLDSDFDSLVAAQLLPQIADRTNACAGLLDAAERGSAVKAVPAWRWAQSNIAAAEEHFLQSAIAMDAQLASLAPSARLAAVDRWLEEATRRSALISTSLGPGCKTRVSHVPAWLEAFRIYRSIHKA